MANYVLQDNTPLILKAYNKTTFECFEKKITYLEWKNLKKKSNFQYYAYQV